jgi:hypothetical protein
MGTSASNRGSPGGAPLVPPWADSDGQGPGPEPDPQRFRGFRTTLGRFVATGNADYGRGALGRFASTALGGSSPGVRRFSSAIAAGARLSDLVFDLAQGGTGEAIVGFDVAALRGQDVNFVIGRIVEALCPTGTVDDEATRAALDEALCAVLSDQPDFDPDLMSLEMLDEIMIKFTEEEIYLQIVTESGNAFDKVTDPTVLIRRENELRELIRVVVDKDGRPILTASLKALHELSHEQVIRELFGKILRAFEEYIE